MKTPAATRITDTTVGICDIGAICCPHDRCGVNITASPNVYINNLKAHRQGDTGDCRCPHGGIYESVGCSETVFINGKGATRIGDLTVCMNCGCDGVHETASPNVYIGG